MYRGHFPPLGHPELVEEPPVTFEDETGRSIDLRAYGDGPVDDEYEAIVDLYCAFDPADRTLGIPPTDEAAVRAWLDRILAGHCVVAWHDERAVGQAVLVPDGEGRHELAIFLRHGFQGAGIGHRLVEALLSQGRAHGVDHVWLVVDRENDPAVALYRDAGFAVVEEGSELRMALSMSPDRVAPSVSPDRLEPSMSPDR